MDWFKHQTDSHEDPVISDAMDKFGDAGYTFFFILIEVYGKEYNNIDSEGWLTIPRTFLQRKLRKSSAKVQQLFNFYQESSKVFFKIEGNKVSFTIPKFLERASTWAKRTKRFPQPPPPEAPPEAPHKNRTTETELDKEEEDKEEEKTNNTPSGYVYYGDKLKVKVVHDTLLRNSFPDYHMDRIYREVGIQAAEAGKVIMSPVKYITKCITTTPNFHRKSRLDDLDYRKEYGLEVDDATP